MHAVLKRKEESTVGLCKDAPKSTADVVVAVWMPIHHDNLVRRVDIAGARCKLRRQH